MCYEEEEYGELECPSCGSISLELVERYEELGIFYKEYICSTCGEPFMDEREEEIDE